MCLRAKSIQSRLTPHDPVDYSLLSPLSMGFFFAALWTEAHQASLSMGFSRKEYWTGLPCPSPGALPDSGMEPTSHYVSCIGRWVLYH